MTLLVVVAHPDDETFACGSILMHAAGRTRTVVACATRGEAGELAPGVPEPEHELAVLREGEMLRAADLLGVDEVEILDLVDSGMEGPAPEGSLCGVPFDALVATVRDLLVRHRPSVVVTLDGSDGHRDHVRLRDAAVDAVGGSVPLYLHCLPRSLMHAWLLHRAGEASARVYAELPQIGTPDEDVTTVLDTAAHYGRRLRAIAAHRSQTSPFDGLPEDLSRAFLAEEHLRRVHPPWPGGPLERDLAGLPAAASRPSVSASGHGDWSPLHRGPGR